MTDVLVCPKCGKRSDSAHFIESFCTDCYPFKIKIPEGLGMELCARCNRMHLQGVWQQRDRKKAGDWVASKIRGEISSAEYDVDSGAATITIEKGGLRIEIVRAVPLEIAKVTCPQCSRLSGGYFEAIVQLRGDAVQVDKHKKMFEKALAKKRTFIAKSEEKHGGADLYVGSSKAVLEMMTGLGLRAVISRKLFGRKDGKRLYRTTFALRFE